jgi:hypothetical protein
MNWLTINWFIQTLKLIFKNSSIAKTETSLGLRITKNRDRRLESNLCTKTINKFRLVNKKAINHKLN